MSRFAAVMFGAASALRFTDNMDPKYQEVASILEGILSKLVASSSKKASLAQAKSTMDPKYQEVATILEGILANMTKNAQRKTSLADVRSEAMSLAKKNGVEDAMRAALDKVTV